MIKITALIAFLLSSCATVSVVYRSPLDECRKLHCPAVAKEQQEQLLSTTYDEIDDSCVCELGNPGNLYVQRRK